MGPLAAYHVHQLLDCLTPYLLNWGADENMGLARIASSEFRIASGSGLRATGGVGVPAGVTAPLLWLNSTLGL